MLCREPAPLGRKIDLALRLGRTDAGAEVVPPSRNLRTAGQGGGLVHPTGDGAGEAVGRGRADGDEVVQLGAPFRAPGRGGEDGVAVRLGVGEAERLVQAAPRGDREALGLRLGQLGVRGDEGDGGAGPRPALPAKFMRSTSTPVCWLGSRVIRAACSTSPRPRPPGSTPSRASSRP